MTVELGLVEKEVIGEVKQKAWMWAKALGCGRACKQECPEEAMVHGC